MKFLGVAVAFLVLAVSLEYANAVPRCPTNYHWHGKLGLCMRKFHDQMNFYNANLTCINDGARLLYEHISEAINGMDMYWLDEQLASGNCSYINNANVKLNSSCDLIRKFICVIDPNGWELMCNCTIHSDPVLKTCDNATISVVGVGTYTVAISLHPVQCAFQVDVIVLVIGWEFCLRWGNNWFTIYFRRYEVEVLEGVSSTVYPHDPHDPTELITRESSTMQQCGFDIFWRPDGFIIFQASCCDFLLAYKPEPKPDGHITMGGDEYFGGNKVDGVCGDFDGNRMDDYRTKDGTPVYGNRYRNRMIIDSWTP